MILHSTALGFQHKTVLQHCTKLLPVTGKTSLPWYVCQCTKMSVLKRTQASLLCSMSTVAPWHISHSDPREGQLCRNPDGMTCKSAMIHHAKWLQWHLALCISVLLLLKKSKMSRKATNQTLTHQIILEQTSSAFSQNPLPLINSPFICRLCIRIVWNGLSFPPKSLKSWFSSTAFTAFDNRVTTTTFSPNALQRIKKSPWLSRGSLP